MDIYAGSVFLYEAVGWNIYISAASILGITAVYTVLGRGRFFFAVTLSVAYLEGRNSKT